MHAVISRRLSLRSTSRRLIGILNKEQEQHRYRTPALVALQRRRYTECVDFIKSMEDHSAASSSVLDKHFVGREDSYNGIIVDSSLESCRNSSFVKRLEESLKRWRSEKKSTIWFRVDLANADWIPTLVNEGFKFHHAKDNYATMYKWLPEDLESNIPPYAHTNLGVGGFVLNEDTGEILVVKEKRSILDGPTRWKLPGGFADPGEDIPDAVIREVREETGIVTEFESLIGFRHAHGYAFGCSDIYVVARLRPLSKEIRKCQREIAECRWMKLQEYANDANIVQNNRVLAQAMLQYTENQMGLKLVKGEHPVSKKPVSIYLFSPT